MQTESKYTSAPPNTVDQTLAPKAPPIASDTGTSMLR